MVCSAMPFPKIWLFFFFYMRTFTRNCSRMSGHKHCPQDSYIPVLGFLHSQPLTLSSGMAGYNCSSRNCLGQILKLPPSDLNGEIPWEISPGIGMRQKWQSRSENSVFKYMAIVSLFNTLLGQQSMWNVCKLNPAAVKKKKGCLF